MDRTHLEIPGIRRQLITEYGELFDSLSAILYRHDPIKLNLEVKTDEYETEAATILRCLGSCHSAEDVLQVVHKEFVRWFDAGIAGSQEHYKLIALEVWILWEAHLAETHGS